MSTNIHGAANGVRCQLAEKLRQSKLALPIAKAPEQSVAGFPINNMVTSETQNPFVKRFGSDLSNVSTADIIALTLYVQACGTLTEAIQALMDKVESAPHGQTGLPFFDDWDPEHDHCSEPEAVVWSYGSQSKARELFDNGYRIVRSTPDADGDPETICTWFCK